MSRHQLFSPVDLSSDDDLAENIQSLNLNEETQSKILQNLSNTESNVREQSIQSNISKQRPLIDSSTDSSIADENYKTFIKSLTQPRKKNVPRRSLSSFIVADDSPYTDRCTVKLCLTSNKSKLANHYRNNFNLCKKELAEKLYLEINTNVFNNQLPQDLPIIWTGRYRTTAGKCIHENNKTRIELSTKLCDHPEKMLDTLIHEMCHVAVIEIDCDKTNGHGRLWKKWTLKCQKLYPQINPIKRCHEYDVSRYQCVSCSSTIQNPNACCPVCQGRQIRRKNELTPFAQYVKYNYRNVRNNTNSHKQVMNILSNQYKTLKDNI